MTKKISAWLEDLGLAKYVDVFAENDIDIDVLGDLKRRDLKEMGVTAGDRLRLLKAIKTEFSEASDTVPTSVDPHSDPTPTPPQSGNDAERRPLTVMFCDLADSTKLSTKLDPEDLQDIIRAYQNVCTKLIQRYGGFVAKYMGDGILVYFGYPKSLENNAERAVRSALDSVKAIQELDRTIGREKGVTVSIRVGIATGIVVVGEIVGEGMARERTVIGEAPNLAARLQGRADQNGIVVGGLTKDLCGDVFEYEDLGSNPFKGIDGLVQTWGVNGLRESGREAEESETDKVVTVPEPVGRSEEIGLLRRAWQATKEDARGQVVLMTGEAGIGKSILSDWLRAKARVEDLPRITLRCSPYHTNSAFHPVIEYFKRLAGWQPDDDVKIRLRKLESTLEPYSQPIGETLPLLASLLSLPLPEDRFPPIVLTPQEQKRQIQDAIMAIVLETAERQPALLLWEDLHWADPSSLELVGLLIEQVPTASLLLVLTARPDFIPAWPARSHITPITLNRLERPHAQALIIRIAETKPLPEEVIEHVVTKTDGVPLYLEELTKTILASDILVETGDHFELARPLSSLSIPETLQEALMARLDRLPQVRELAQLGSVLGREFAYDMISGLSSSGDRMLQDGLEQLVEAELLYRRGRPPRAKYIFKHALIQDAAYESLLRRTRQQYHLQAAELLEDRFPEIVETHPEIIAQHFSEAKAVDRAVGYFLKAGEQALLKSANEEAIAHLGKGLDIIRGNPAETDSEQNELSLLMMIAPALVAARGYSAPEIEPVYRRALQLSQTLADAEKQFSVLLGLFLFHLLKSEILAARDMAGQAVALAKNHDGPGIDGLAAARALGLVQCFHGEFEAATTGFEQVSKSYDVAVHGSLAFRRGGTDVGVGALATSGLALFALGYPDQASNRCAEGLALAGKLGHPISKAYAHFCAAMIHMERGELGLSLDHAASAMEIAEDKRFPQYIAWTTGVRGAVNLDQGNVDEAIADTRKAIEANQALGSRLWDHYWWAVLAGSYRRKGQVEQSLAAIAEAIDHVARTEERYYEAEIYRMKGELICLGDAGDASEAEDCFLKAIRIAQEQMAKSWELRAAMSLAQLWQQRDRKVEARNLLKEVYGRFTEGFDTADLKKAKTLLNDLA